MFVFLLFIASLRAVAPALVPTATIADGPVIGVATSGPDSTVGVNKYLGIPFAKSPPVRFSPPEDPLPWTTPLQATAFKPTCMQAFDYPNNTRSETMRLFNNPGFPMPVENEDCLYLNVYTPAATPSTPLPVMVWIFGGNLAFGSGSIENYDGSSFAANQNVVVVTFNYRTNAFGFSASPEVPTGQQNSGFLDQRKALTWVQENIHAFGGDCEKVTIFGESAGGLSVKQLVALPPSPLPFRAAILQSVGGSFPIDPAASWTQLVTLTNCSTAPSQINCVRQIPALQIKDIIERNSIGWGPVSDSVTYTSSTRSLFLSKKTAQIPLLHGSNSQEGRVFAYLANLSPSTPTSAIAPFLNLTFPSNPALQTALLSLYPPSIASVPYKLISQILTDYIFTCTTSALSTITALSGIPTWRYYFDASFPNLQLFPEAGVWHSTEIPEVFGNYQRAGATGQQRELSRYMQGAWARFARNPGLGPGWTGVGKGLGVELGVLGRNGDVGEMTRATVEVDYVCAVYGPVIAAMPL